MEGTGVVSGLAYAPVAWVRRPEPPSLTGPELPADEVETAMEQFRLAADAVVEGLEHRAAKSEGDASEVLKMTAGLARDKAWRKSVNRHIKSGVQPVNAVAKATEEFVNLFLKAGGLMAERVTDLRDIRDRVAARLEGRPEPGLPEPSEPVVLLADDLAPVDTAGLDPELFVALATELGGPTSHTAIIARQLGIPCVVAVGKMNLLEEGDVVLLDGGEGTLRLGADPEQAKALVKQDLERREKIAAWSGPARTKDGHAVQLLANVQDPAGAARAAQSEAEGVGLFRTELCFLGTATEPSIDNQAKQYRGVFEAFAGHKVVVRTLDSGSDKPVPFATLADEPNPSLGVRGIRTLRINDGLLSNQLDAIKQATEGVDVEAWVMCPMISTLPEARDVTRQIRARGLKAGIMVEVPSTALLIDQFMNEVDFVSIGTNDLTQYVMAADRLSANLADFTTPWQPAVLNLMARVAEAGARKGKPVGVCGEAAADPLMACVLVGMGMTSLSMAAGAISAVGAALSEVTLEQCQAAARAVISAFDDEQAQNTARAILNLS
ncbi:phosphoenolpyruvate--protein phosphotransferase [Boudabousia liubingyangii]|uniref:Phosphoenolpyruvate-protein phosphotransferase n=2 Tax=Boudabousia liubingyangii TaxID=1921764 RepID=A0A1Q5PKE2_9ACTO|nr:phosphoenolpyruvate--protein phosphotransferase [Boudabousia liubingyangii]OKL47127.1 phosphoenolpyruvate--protein phosphotransferase [Boudabousia liubingyangii]